MLAAAGFLARVFFSRSCSQLLAMAVDSAFLAPLVQRAVAPSGLEHSPTRVASRGPGGNAPWTLSYLKDNPYKAL